MDIHKIFAFQVMHQISQFQLSNQVSFVSIKFLFTQN